MFHEYSVIILYAIIHKKLLTLLMNKEAAFSARVFSSSEITPNATFIGLVNEFLLIGVIFFCLAAIASN